jgi:hypothetical protein
MGGTAQSRPMTSLPLPSRLRRGMVAAGCAAAALALSPALASADSIVYVKDATSGSPPAAARTSTR